MISLILSRWHEAHVACEATTSEESTDRDRCSGEVPTRIRTEKQERKQANTIFNEVRQFAYVLGARERDFIDSTINTREYQRDTSRDTIH